MKKILGNIISRYTILGRDASLLSFKGLVAELV